MTEASWVALVAEEMADEKNPKVLHMVGLPPELTAGEDERVRLPWPRIVILEKQEGAESWMMFRYTARGDFAGDTWHQTLEDAKHQAQYEFGHQLGPWIEVPPEAKSGLDFGLKVLGEQKSE